MLIDCQQCAMRDTSACDDCVVTFLVAGAEEVPDGAEGVDYAVSGLVLNLLPDPQGALTRLTRRLRPNGTIAAYVWDYADGIEFLRHFWDSVRAADPSATGLDEGRRFPICRPDALESLFRERGLADVACDAIEIGGVRPKAGFNAPRG